MDSTPGGRLLKCSWTAAPARWRDAAGQWLFVACWLLFVCRRLRWGLLPIFHCAFEILDRVAQALAQIAQLAGTKEYQRDHEDDDQLRNTESSTKHCLLQPELHTSVPFQIRICFNIDSRPTVKASQRTISFVFSLFFLMQQPM